MKIFTFRTNVIIIAKFQKFFNNMVFSRKEIYIMLCRHRIIPDGKKTDNHLTFMFSPMKKYIQNHQLADICRKSDEGFFLSQI